MVRVVTVAIYNPRSDRGDRHDLEYEENSSAYCNGGHDGSLRHVAYFSRICGTVPVPKPEYVAAGTEEALKLLRLMDADNSGKVSRAEFMAFMAAEFDRLDINHDGELDLKELKNSRVVMTQRGGSRR